MPRGGWQRRWVKFYPTDCFEGSIRWQLEADERGVWYDMVMFSALCAEPGQIADKDNRAYPHTFIASRLNVPLELFERTLAKCNEEGRTKENSNGIAIVNFYAYQSEYLRQKPYRQKGGTDSIFTLWNEQQIIVHQKLTPEIEQAIDRVLKNFTIEEITQAIKNYSEILSGGQYYFKYKWTLRDFLRRGLEKFALDPDIVRENYLIKGKERNGEHRGHSQPPKDGRYTKPDDYRIPPD